MKNYKIIYRLDRGRPGDFTDVEIVADHLPPLGVVVALPDGSGRYGRVIAVERV